MALLPLINDKPAYLGEPSLLGEILVDQGRNHDTLEFLREAKEVTSPRMIALNMALAHCRLGDLEAARKLYLDELDTSPPSFHGTDETLRQFFLDKHNARLRALPGVHNLPSLEAAILLARGNRRLTMHPKGALADYKAAAELAPNNWVIAEQIGEALYRLERRDEATPYYRRAVQLGGDNLPDWTRERAKM